MELKASFWMSSEGFDPFSLTTLFSLMRVLYSSVFPYFVNLNKMEKQKQTLAVRFVTYNICYLYNIKLQRETCTAKF